MKRIDNYNDILIGMKHITSSESLKPAKSCPKETNLDQTPR